MLRKTYIEPRQPALWYSPWAMISGSTASMLKPRNRQHPILRGDASKIILLTVQVWCNVVTEKGEEAGNGKSLVTVADDFEVDGMSVEDE